MDRILFFQYSNSAVVAIRYFGEVGSSNTPYSLVTTSADPSVSDLTHKDQVLDIRINISR